MTLLAWYDQNKRNLPWRLDQAGSFDAGKVDPYPVWVSEIMLQQTLIAVVIPAWQKFMTRFPDVFALAAAPSDDIRPAVKGLGYYRRFDLLHRAAKLLAAASPDGKKIPWPKTRDEWKTLPGIGDYTSAAIASIAMNIPAAVVDGNVERVLCRMHDIRKPPNLPELKPLYRDMMTAWLDSSRPGDFNQAVMELGQRICTPTSPDCSSCPVANKCLALKRRSQHLAPAPKIRPEYEDVMLDIIVWTRQVRDQKKSSRTSNDYEVALFSRTSSERFLKGTNGFWYTDTDLKFPDKKIQVGKNSAVTAIGQIKHSITRHKIAARINWCHGNLPSALMSLQDAHPRWVAPDAIEDALISSFDLKAWRTWKSFYQSSKPAL